MLDKALRKLGWRRADLARRLNLRPETISRWGERPPEYVVKYLEAMLALQAIRKEIDRIIAG